MLTLRRLLYFQANYYVQLNATLLNRLLFTEIERDRLKLNANY